MVKIIASIVFWITVGININKQKQKDYQIELNKNQTITITTKGKEYVVKDFKELEEFINKDNL
jgi:CRISPR/Cas system-associated exonuclease Cas4 (RecB family)